MEIKLSDKGKQDFIQIIKLMQSMYKKTAMEKTVGFQFRENLVKYSVDKLSLVVKYIGQYDYQISAWVEDETLPLELRQQSWIHCDGIKEERDKYSDGVGERSHPVFSINCLTDIYNREVSNVTKLRTRKVG